MHLIKFLIISCGFIISTIVWAVPPAKLVDGKFENKKLFNDAKPAKLFKDTFDKNYKKPLKEKELTVKRTDPTKKDNFLDPAQNTGGTLIIGQSDKEKFYKKKSSYILAEKQKYLAY